MFSGLDITSFQLIAVMSLPLKVIIKVIIRRKGGIRQRRKERVLGMKLTSMQYNRTQILRYV
jgi:hypothetical protein